MSSIYIRPFMVKGDTVNLVVSGAANERVAVSQSGVGIRSMRIANIGTATVFIKFGTSTTSALITDGFPMLANSVESFCLQNEITHVAAVGTAGSTIYITTGESA